jgi:hypothetical protein
MWCDKAVNIAHIDMGTVGKLQSAVDVKPGREGGFSRDKGPDAIYESGQNQPI